MGSVVQVHPDPPQDQHLRKGEAGKNNSRGSTLAGAIAQLGERLLCKQEVTGSIPVGSTRILQNAAPSAIAPPCVLFRLLFNNSEEVEWVRDCITSAYCDARAGDSAHRYRVKRLSACGGCLGDDRRRRTLQPAISFGELASEL